MKAALFVILLPLMSVLIMSLYVAGGASRTAALVLLVVSVIGTVAGLLRRQVAAKKERQHQSVPGLRGANSVVEEAFWPLVYPRDMGSFDSVRHSSHSAHDDSGIGAVGFELRDASFAHKVSR